VTKDELNKLLYVIIDNIREATNTDDEEEAMRHTRIALKAKREVLDYFDWLNNQDVIKEVMLRHNDALKELVTR
jgi:hypothetical protein